MTADACAVRVFRSQTCEANSRDAFVPSGQSTAVQKERLSSVCCSVFVRLPLRVLARRVRAMASKLEAERLAALRDFDDDDDPNQNRSALDIGRDNVWQEQVAVKNADGSRAETAFDGYMRIGTNREILSWPGDSGEYYLVKTEADEAKAQALLKKERTAIRNSSLEAKAERHRQEAEERARRNREFKARQKAAQEQELAEKRQDRELRRLVTEREGKVRGFQEAVKEQSRMLFNKPQVYSPTRAGSSSARSTV